MKNGITYYRLKSPYEGDYLKNCGLEGSEIDNNFFVLEGRDVKSIDVIGDDIVLTLINGDTLSAEDAFKGYVKNLSFSFDEEKGVLVITKDDEVLEIPGFTAECCPVATDSTLVGDGTKENPLGIASGQLTGHYKPVIGLIDLTSGDEIPDKNLHIGDRYIVKDSISTNGLLYDYQGVMTICRQLKGSEWRIPSIEDWNNMLNSIEPDDAYRTHSTDNKALWQGKYAGKFLKSVDTQDDENKCGWAECDNDPCGGCASDCDCENGCDENVNQCVTHDCGHVHQDDSSATEQSKSGIDCFGFGVEPVGYGITQNGGETFMYGQRSYFWTSTKSESRNVAYVVGFDACRTTVQKDVVPFDNLMSIRLVKDYNGSNFYGQENINNKAFDTVLMEQSNTIWTRSNVAFPVCGCHSESPNTNGCSDDLTVYYVIEWNGTSWVYTVVNVGYTITIIEDGTPTDYSVVINNETGEAELVKKDYGSDEMIADLAEIKNKLSVIESIIGDYASDKGTIAERLDTIENKLDAVESKLNNWLDFNDRNNDDIDEPEIPYNKDEDGGGDGIKIGVDEEGENIYW